MIENVQIWTYGAAVLIDSVLLFAFLERHNRRSVPVWMMLLALGVWTWHGGIFIRQLVNSSIGPLADPVKWLSMVSMALGLMLMPSAALHGTCRLLRHKAMVVAPAPDPRLAACYLPLLSLIFMCRSLAIQPSDTFTELLSGYAVPYVIWLCLVSGVTAFGLIKTSLSLDDQQTRRFYGSVAASTILIAIVTANFVYGVYRDPMNTIRLQNIVVISPIIPVLLFGYYVMRFQLLPLVLERALVYGAILACAGLFHQIVLLDVLNKIEVRSRLNLQVFEGFLVLMVILWYQPLRYRFAEALQSLLDPSTSRRGDRQQLAIQLASRAGQPTSQLLAWFTETMQQTFGSKLAAGWLCDSRKHIVDRAGQHQLLEDSQVTQILTSMSGNESAYFTRYTATDPTIADFMTRVRAGALLKFDHVDHAGLFLIGCRAWGQPPNTEDLHALLLLVEQFGVTLHSSRSQALRIAAEQRLIQQEKLSTIGLIAGSLAHEIKNPLSTIKTITRVLSEELGPTSPHAEDLRMISGEIERLSVSTSELLEAARPPREGKVKLTLDELLSPTLRLLRHLARERRANLNVDIQQQTNPISIDQISLREIVFNLISNGLEAAGEGGAVCLTARSEPQWLVIEVRDTGPGFTAEQQPLLFEPFFTTKPTGTGLGLYIVARRVHDLGGQIECQSHPQQGTMFLVRFPVTSIQG